MKGASVPSAALPVPRRDLPLLFAAAVLVNTAAAVFITRPGYVDAYYYFDGALQLARGLGFREPYIWSYLALAAAPAGAGLWPSHMYWMPLTSLVPAPFMAAAAWLAGGQPLSHAALFRAAQVPFVLLAALLPLLSYQVAWLTSGLRRHAVAAGLLTVFTPFYFLYWPNTDSFALHALFAAGALLAITQAERGSPRANGWRLAAGALAGLAHLTRADGLLVLLVLAAWVLMRGRRAADGRAVAGGQVAAVLVLLAGYLFVMAPWFARNWALTGALLPAGGARTLWLVSYNDIFNYSPASLTPARYLAAGLPSILAGKAAALGSNLATLVGAQTGIVAIPFALLGLWRLRRCALYGPALMYGLALFALMTFAFSFPGARGGYLHSGAAMLPFLYPAALVGLDWTVEAVARRRPAWKPAAGRQVFTAALLVFACALTLWVFRAAVIGTSWREPAWGQRDAVYAQAGDWLAASGQSGALAAVNNPPGWYYLTGLPSIVIPNGGIDDLLLAMDTHGARWLVLDINHPDGLAELYAQPNTDARLRLRHTLDAGKPVFLFERTGLP